MGAGCCVAAREQNVQQGSSHDRSLHRSSRESPPSWSFCWDNRHRVAGEDNYPSWLSDRLSRSGTWYSKSVADVSAHSSNTGGMMENDRTGAWCKSVMEDRISVYLRPSASVGQSPAANITVEAGFSESPQPPESAYMKSVPSLSMLPISLSERQQQHLTPASTGTTAAGVPSRTCESPSQQSLSLAGIDSPTLMDEMHPRHYQFSYAASPLSLSESTRGSDGGRRADNWSTVQTFSEPMSAASLSFE